jgi:hypothetical protein
MELVIQPNQILIQHTPTWMLILLSLGLLLFFVSYKWRRAIKQSGRYSFLPGVLFTVSFICLIGGINLYVFKVVFNKDGVTFFNIQNFNHQIQWGNIARVDYSPHQLVSILVNENNDLKTYQLSLKALNKADMMKVKQLFEYKLRQHQKTSKVKETNS